MSYQHTISLKVAGLLER